MENTQTQCKYFEIQNLNTVFTPIQIVQSFRYESVGVTRIDI